jgi:hypothetical protein
MSPTSLSSVLRALRGVACRSLLVTGTPDACCWLNPPNNVTRGGPEFWTGWALTPASLPRWCRSSRSCLAFQVT